MKKSKPVKQGFIWIASKKLKPHPLNTTLFGDNDTNFEELKQSILENGFLVNHPILCCQKDKSLMIISGHRRWRAACELGIDEVPIVIIDMAEEEAERIIIEENLVRPKEGREFSYVERYILALRLSHKFPELRGGDRRSEDFRANCGSRQNDKSTGKDQWLSVVTGICSKYLSELNVISKRILQDSEKAYPELLQGLQIYEQLQIILNKGLSQDLSELHIGNESIRKVYNKYKFPKKQFIASNNKESSLPENTITTPTDDINNSSVPSFRATELAITEQSLNSCAALLQGLKDFLAEHFVGHSSFGKAMIIISVPAPENPIASLQMMRKAANLLLRNTGNPGTETKKATDNQSLPLFQKREKHDTEEINPNGGIS